MDFDRSNRVRGSVFAEDLLPGSERGQALRRASPWADVEAHTACMGEGIV